MAARKRGSQRAQQVATTGSSGTRADTASTSSTGTRATRRRGGAQDGSAKDSAVQVNQHSPAQERNTSVEISAEQALAAVESLYADELKPVGRILRKRVAELLVAEGSDVQNPSFDVDADQLRTACCDSAACSIEPEEGGDWSALLLGRERAFVDIYNPEDSYPDAMWSGLRAYCESSDGQSMSLPGGRYACARALVARGLPCLVSYSLGRVCHIVQLAITQKKILGYMNGSVVAYSKSQSKVKEQCASQGQALASTTPGAEVLPVASFEEARTSMRQILEESSGQVPLSNVKRLFRSKFQLELSETSLGHPKLSELLQDPDFHDVCTVELREHGYIVVQAFKVNQDSDDHDAMEPLDTASVDDSPRRVLFCPDEPLTLEDAGVLLTPAPIRLVPSPLRATPGCGVEDATPSLAMSPLNDSSDDFIGGVPKVQRTFIQYNVPRTPLPGSRRRSCSVPKDLILGMSESMTESDAAQHMQESGGRNSRLSTVPSSGYTGEDTPALSIGSAEVSSSNGDDDEDPCESADPFAYEQQLHFCPDEPLKLEDAGIVIGGAPMQEPMPTWKPYTPGMLAREGCIVQNTFFHIPPVLPTPVRTGAVRRTQSVPKDVGYTCSDLQEASAVVEQPSATAQQPSTTSCQPKSSVASPTLASPPPSFWPPSPHSAEPAAGAAAASTGAAANDGPQQSFVWSMPWRQPVLFEPPLMAPEPSNLSQPAPVRASRPNILYIEQYL